MTERLIVLFGISGAGKSTFAAIVAQRLGIAHFDLDSFYRHRKPSVTLSNGENVSNYDCWEAIDLKRLIAACRTQRQLVLSAFACNDVLLRQICSAPIVIELKLATTPSEIIARCLAARAESKRFGAITLARDKLMVPEVTYAFYAKILPTLTISHTMLVYDENGRRSRAELVQELIEYLVT